MNAPIAMRERILAAAERRIRAAGYNAVSFREIAAEVGVKSASVHYHFPRKQDLGAALVGRYTENFSAELERISATAKDPETLFRSYLQLHRDALMIDQSICLCAILGAESIGLPEKVNVEVRRFFLVNIDWLAKTLPPSPDRPEALSPAEIVAGLQGAMIVSAVLRDRTILDRTAARMLAAHGVV